MRDGTRYVPGLMQLQSLTKALSQRLYALFRAPMYYQQPRFHVSVAYWEPSEACPRAALERISEELAAALNRSLDADLRALRPIYAQTITVQVGKARDSVTIHTRSK